MSIFRRVARTARRAARIASKGEKAFASAVKKAGKDPVLKSAIRMGTRAVPKGKLLKVARKAASSGAKSLRESVRFAAMTASFVPGAGTGVAAALGAADALASGKKLSDAVLAAARNAVPGGAAARAAFDFGAGLAQGKSLKNSALSAARERLPGGKVARAAFDAGLALSRGRKIQDAAREAVGRSIPASPYAADPVKFVRSVTRGTKIPDAALSTAGRQLRRRMSQPRSRSRRR